jgi:hypothetical protein
LQKDLEELENTVYPRYKAMAANVETERAELDMHYRKLATAADQQGEVWHREITEIVTDRKLDIEEMKNKHLSALIKNSDEITQKMKELKQTIAELNSILNSNNTSLAFTYKSRNVDFTTLPSTVRATLPSFSPQKVKKDWIHEMFGSLSSLTITSEPGDTMTSAEAVTSPPARTLLDDPQVTATIDTNYKTLYRASCLSDDKVWTCGYNKTMKLLNLQGELLTSVQTESGNWPDDIAVTRDGGLIYTDYRSRTVNLVTNQQVQAVITLQGWRPLIVCSTASDDLLILMESDDRRQSKIVRYSGSTEKQTVQYDDHGQPLYSAEYSSKYICENRNLDICVADRGIKAVVVVNQSGKLRCRYTGHKATAAKAFAPAGIANRKSVV